MTKETEKSGMEPPFFLPRTILQTTVIVIFINNYSQYPQE